MNNTPLASKRNCSIDIFRLLFAIYVVALHSTPASLAEHSFLSVIIKSFFRFSVPFFFMVSGYYFFRNSGRITFNYIFTYIKRIVITYFFWSCLYFIINFIKWGHRSIPGFVIDCVYSFFVRGSYYHLWYFPSLIFSLCVSALLCLLGYKKTLLIISICVYPLFQLLIEYDLLSFIPAAHLSRVITCVSIFLPFTQGLFYFGCGQLIKFFYDKYSTNRKSHSLIYILPISVLLWFALIIADYFIAINLSLVIIFGIFYNVGFIVLVLLTNPLPNHSLAAKQCRFLANFIYYSHPIFRFLLELVNNHSLHLSDYWNFPITIITSIVFGMLLYRINNKYINRFIY